MTNTKIFVGELDRFGYVLRYFGNSEEEVRKALMKCYIKAFKDINGVSPDKEEKKCADDEMFIEEVKLGKVEWK